MEDLSGRSFGVYRVVEPLGAGGMAAVYKAYQPAVDRHVALKILPDAFAATGAETPIGHALMFLRA